MANDYDKILKDNFREPKAALLRQLIPETITSIRPMVPRLQRTIEREPDMVTEITTADGKRFIIHIEWQSSNEGEMAARMAFYDLLLAQTYQLEVLGAVIYLGNEPMRMKNSYGFFDFSYRCQMIDARQLDPEIFLRSDDAGELIFAILTGNGGIEQKRSIVHRIISKLQELYSHDIPTLRMKIRQLEILSLLRDKIVQQLIIQEESNMPVTIDIRKDLRYQQGVEEGKVEDRNEIAKKLLGRGMDLLSVQEITGLPFEKLNEIINSPKKD